MWPAEWYRMADYKNGHQSQWFIKERLIVNMASWDDTKIINDKSA